MIGMPCAGIRGQGLLQARLKEEAASGPLRADNGYGLCRAASTKLTTGD